MRPLEHCKCFISSDFLSFEQTLAYWDFLETPVLESKHNSNYQGRIKCFSCIIFTSLKRSPETVIVQLQFIVPLCQSKNWEIQDANRLHQLFQQQEILLCRAHCLKVHTLFKTWPCPHSESINILSFKSRNKTIMLNLKVYERSKYNTISIPIKCKQGETEPQVTYHSPTRTN